MATRRYAATIEFGAALSSSFNSVLGATRRRVDELGRAITRTRASAGLAEALGQQRRRFGDANDWREGAQGMLREHQANAWEANTPAGRRRTRELERDVRNATAEFNRQRVALADLSQRARAAGVDINNLSAEERRLNQELAAIDSEHARLTNVQAGTRRLGETMDRLKTGVGRVGEAFERDFGRASRTIGLVVAGASAAGFAMYRIARSFVDSGKEVLNLADSLNTTTAALQAWQFAATKAGIPEDSFRSGIGQFQRSIEEGSKGAVEGLTKLNISYSRLKKLPVGQQLLVIAEKFKTYKGEANKAAMAQALFGEAGVRLLPVLNKGAAGMEEVYQQAKKTGYLLDGEMKNRVEDGASAFGTLGMAVKGVSNIVGSELEPTFADAARALTDFVTKNNAEIRAWAKEASTAFHDTVIPAVKAFIKELPGLWQSLKATGKEIWDTVNAVKDFAGSWGNLGAALLALNFAPTILAIGQLIPLLWSAGTASWALLGPWGLLAVAVGAAAAAIIWNWDAITDKLMEWKTKLGEVMDEAGAKIMGALKPAFDWIGAQFDRISGVLTAFLDKISAGTNKVREFFGGGVSLGTTSFQPSGASIAGGAILMPPQTLQSTNSGGSKTQTNNFNISVHAPGANGAEIANGIRSEVRRKPLYDMQSVLAPN
jgi:hypothetical protein